MLQPFHLAVPVHDLQAARDFYGQLFGCPEGRSSVEWVDFDFFGHQLVAHLEPGRKPFVEPLHTNEVDGKHVPVPHFGVVLEWQSWQQLAERLRAAGAAFVIEPGILLPVSWASKRRSSCTTRRGMPSSSRRSATPPVCLPSERIALG